MPKTQHTPIKTTLYKTARMSEDVAGFKNGEFVSVQFVRNLPNTKPECAVYRATSADRENEAVLASWYFTDFCL
jgi:hypothetical protein